MQPEHLLLPVCILWFTENETNFLVVFKALKPYFLLFAVTRLMEQFKQFCSVVH